MNATMTHAAETLPAGYSGLVIEPWTPGETYGVAADWAQASCPVLIYGADGWTSDEHGRQVADFRHHPAEALDCILREALTAGGDDEDDAAGLVGDAVEIPAD